MARLVIGTSKAATTPAVVKTSGDIIYYTDASGYLRANPTNPDFVLNAQYVGNFLYQLFYKSDVIKTLDLSAVGSIESAYLATADCVNLEEVIFPTGGGNGFSAGQRSFKSFCSDCPKLKRVGGLENIYYANNTEGFSSMFSNCSSLEQELHFSSLQNVSGSQCFSGCFSNTKIPALYFPALNTGSFGSRTNAFNWMLSGVDGCTVHFPSNLQSVIGSWSDVTNGFSGTNTTVLFDLPATVTLTGGDSVNYVRAPKFDTQTALAWIQRYTEFNVAPKYYTNGLTDPTVGTTIYSDAACTISVTTVSSIA